MRSRLAKSLIASVIWALLSIVGVVRSGELEQIIDAAYMHGESFSYDRLYARPRVVKTIYTISAGVGGVGVVTCLIVWAVRQDPTPGKKQHGFDVIATKRNT